MKYILLNITLLIIIIYMLNKLSDNYLKNIFKKFLFKNKKEDNFYSNINLPIKHSKKLNNFFSNMVSKSPYNNTNIKSKIYKVNKKEEIHIINFFKKKFNSYNKKIKKIHIIDRILFSFSSNPSRFEFKPLIIMGEYYYNKKLIGIIKLQIELYFIIEKNGNLFINPNNFNNKCGTYLINRIFLIDFNKELKLKKNVNDTDTTIINESPIMNENYNNTASISSIMSDDMNFSSDVNSSLLSFTNI